MLQAELGGPEMADSHQEAGDGRSGGRLLRTPSRYHNSAITASAVCVVRAAPFLDTSGFSPHFAPFNRTWANFVSQ